MGVVAYCICGISFTNRFPPSPCLANSSFLRYALRVLTSCILPARPRNSLTAQDYPEVTVAPYSDMSGISTGYIVTLCRTRLSRMNPLYCCSFFRYVRHIYKRCHHFGSGHSLRLQYCTRRLAWSLLQVLLRFVYVRITLNPDAMCVLR